MVKTNVCTKSLTTEMSLCPLSFKTLSVNESYKQLTAGGESAVTRDNFSCNLQHGNGVARQVADEIAHLTSPLRNMFRNRLLLFATLRGKLQRVTCIQQLASQCSDSSSVVLQVAGKITTCNIALLLRWTSIPFGESGVIPLYLLHTKTPQILVVPVRLNHTST